MIIVSNVDRRPAPLARITDLRRQNGALVTLTFSYLGDRFPGQIWMRCKARKPSRCVATGVDFNAGDAVYRPFTNQGNRMYRIAAAFVDARC